MPEISVVIPVYNAEPYLRDCLDSVLSQSFTDWEALCVDSYSKDASYDILQEYAAKDARIRVFRNDKDGVCQARNVGLDNASGAFLMFVDSDDFIHPRYMEIMRGAMIRETADIVQARHVRVPHDAKFADVPQTDLSPACETQTDAMRKIFTKSPCPFNQKHDSWVNIWKKLYRASAMNGLRFSPELFNEDDADYSLFSELAAKKKVWIDSVLYFYRENPNSITRKLNIERYCRSCSNRIPLWHERLMNDARFAADLRPLLIQKQTRDAYRMLVRKALKRGGSKDLLNEMQDKLARYESQGMIDRKYLNFGGKTVFAAFMRKRFHLAECLLRIGF